MASLPARSLAAALLVALVAWLAFDLSLERRVQREARTLVSIAAEGAGQISGARHASIRTEDDAESDAFATMRSQLLALSDKHDLESPVYTLRAVGPDQTEFVVMTNVVSFTGDRWVLSDTLRPLFEGQATRAGTGLYRSVNGEWISGYAVITGPDGGVEAVVAVDRPSEDLFARRAQGRMLAILLGLLAGGVVRLLPTLVAMRTGPVAALRQLFVGRLATRIGLASSISVILAVGIVTTLDHVQARRDTIDGVAERLLVTVRTGAAQVDPVLHQEIAASGNADTVEFRRMRRRLRFVQEAAGLGSPVYTLRRDGNLTRFVVMTNEVPFLGDAYELRPGVAATFESGDPGWEGPYTDAHGTWISAWAPIIDAEGLVVAVLQADEEIDDLIATMNNRTLLRALFGLVGVAVALGTAGLLGRSIALPVREIAHAADRVGAGDLAITLPEDRIDELGLLARSINNMARGLEEKQRLRDMFGKYMATQVVADLLDRGELQLHGELREITVLISDIRGYTALTEELGGPEIVALLNEYFSILVDVVIEQEGVIDKFMGDAMLCWFGAPVHQEDHRQRALMAALAILERTEAWNAARAAAGLPAVETGIGLASGAVVIGNIGSPQRLEYTAIGDAVNLASRLCSKADAGEILVTQAIADVAPSDCDLEPMGAMSVKGVSQPLQVVKVRPTALQP